MRKNYAQLFKLKMKWLLLLLLLIVPLWGLAQNSGVSVTWNSQVGCIEYASDPEEKERENFEVWEEIDPSRCVRVCENAQVEYTVNSTNSSITSVTWGVAGGVILSSTTSSPYKAMVKWRLIYFF